MSRLEMSYTGKILLYLYLFSVSFRAWIVLKRSFWQDSMSYFDFLILSLILKNMDLKFKKIVYVKPKCYLGVGVKNCDNN